MYVGVQNILIEMYINRNIQDSRNNMQIGNDRRTADRKI